jgi:hypothetical protein
MVVCLDRVDAQHLSYYVLNLQNGLPSNNAYHCLTDHYGYLWIATEKGVVKYNGYTTQIFDKQNGIPNDDIWYIFSDNKNRIWLSAISNEFGYIYNNTYKKTYSPSSNSSYYPIDIKQRGEDIVFINKGSREPVTLTVDSVHNDTVYSFGVKGNVPHMQRLDENAHFIANLFADNYEIQYRISDTTSRLIAQYPRNYSYIDSAYRVQDGIKNYLVSYHNDAGPLYALNVNSGEFKSISINAEPGEKIYTTGELQREFSVITNKKTIFFDTVLNFVRQYNYASLIGGEASNEYSPSFFNEIPLWKLVMTTSKKGVLVMQDTNRFVRNSLGVLVEAKYVGSTNAGYMYWWSKEKKTMYQLAPDRQVRKLLLPKIYQLSGVKNISLSKVLLMGNLMYYLNEKTLQLTDYYKGFHFIRADHYPFPVKEKLMMSRRSVIDYYEYSDSVHYDINAGSGLSIRIIKNDSITSDVIGLMRPVGLTVDSNENMLWAYGYRSVFIQNLVTRKGIALTTSVLDALGITKIQQILIDKFGNIFIKDNDRLLVFNYRTRTISKLLSNYRLDDAVVTIHNDRLIVAGGFGVLFTLVQGPMQFSSTLAYRNIKHVNYNYLLGKIAIAKDSVILSTDKGIYTVAIPSEQVIRHTQVSVNDFNLLLNYHDSTRQLYSNDTITLNHNNPNIQFDVVNPKGYGRLSYMYRLGSDDTWHTLNNNELYLDNIDADTYYDLQLIIKDSEWRSSPIYLKVYMVPRWWESYWGKRMVWLGVLLSIVGVALSIAYFTKRVVNKRNEEKNIQLELKSLKMAVELKSIYAQINPHFIFNTLSTGLYFIKKGMMKEAYTHITTFSDLLRSFLKASRNKYINLAEDIENLENYIKLQQIRFENKFEYRIHVADNVNANTTLIPSLLLQPIVENAIHHGLFHKEGLGHLAISFTGLPNEDGLVCTIDDDGIGRAQSKMIREETITKTQSYGTDMVKELINILNEHEPILIQLEYVDKQLPDTGTTVIITIKHLPKNA